MGLLLKEVLAPEKTHRKETTSKSLFHNKYMAALKRKYLVDFDIFHFPFYESTL